MEEEEEEDDEKLLQLHAVIFHPMALRHMDSSGSLWQGWPIGEDPPPPNHHDHHHLESLTHHMSICVEYSEEPSRTSGGRYHSVTTSLE